MWPLPYGEHSLGLPGGPCSLNNEVPLDLDMWGRYAPGPGEQQLLRTDESQRDVDLLVDLDDLSVV